MLHTAQQPSRFCLKCLHNLRGIVKCANDPLGKIHRCPECGSEFDPNDAATFNRNPHRRIAANFATIAQTMIIWSLVITAGTAAFSALGMNPLVQIVLCGMLMAPGLLVVPLLILLPCIPLSARWRMAGAFTAVCFLSIVYWQWPLRINFALHKRGFEAYASEIEARRIDPAFPTVVEKRPRRIGLFRIERVIVLNNRNIGFALPMHFGEAKIVKRAPDEPRAWYNTMWISDLGDGWNYVCTD